MRTREVECLAQSHIALCTEQGNIWTYCHSHQADSALGSLPGPASLPVSCDLKENYSKFFSHSMAKLQEVIPENEKKIIKILEGRDISINTYLAYNTSSSPNADNTLLSSCEPAVHRMSYSPLLRCPSLPSEGMELLQTGREEKETSFDWEICWGDKQPLLVQGCSGFSSENSASLETLHQEAKVLVLGSGYRNIGEMHKTHTAAL